MSHLSLPTLIEDLQVSPAWVAEFLEVSTALVEDWCQGKESPPESVMTLLGAVLTIKRIVPEVGCLCQQNDP